MLTTLRNTGTTIGSQDLSSANDSAEMQGKWTAMRAERDGQAAEEIVGHVLHFEGNRFSIQEKGATIYEGTFTLDTSARPCAIDFNHAGHSAKGTTWRGIYQVDGHTLTICDNAGEVRKNRPTSFETMPNSGRVLVVLKCAEE
jgi:uncharacterized protein (TIGR03067 family)